MLSSEPPRVQELVKEAQVLLVSYHQLPSTNTLSLLPIPTQSKLEQWERTVSALAFVKLGPYLHKIIPDSLAQKTALILSNSYLKHTLYNSEIDTFHDLFRITANAYTQCPVTSKLTEQQQFRMVRLLWSFPFFTKAAPSISVYPYAALYPLLDDIFDSTEYSRINKMRFMERLEECLESLKLNTYHPIPVEDEHIDMCLQQLCSEIAKQNPISKRHSLEALSVVRYAEELDYIECKLDVFTRCAIKGCATLRALFALAEADVPQEWPMAFGFVFQMVDDLQDCVDDAKADILTPFSMLVKQSLNLDSQVVRLIQFIQSLLKPSQHSRLLFLNDFLVYLTMEAAIKHRVHLSVQLYKDIRHRLPVTKKWAKRFSLEFEAFKWMR